MSIILTVYYVFFMLAFVFTVKETQFEVKELFLEDVLKLISFKGKNTREKSVLGIS